MINKFKSERRALYYNPKLDELLTFKKTKYGASSGMSYRLFTKVSHNVMTKKGPEYYGFVKIGVGSF